jgi:hypothetical protein
VPGIIAHWQCYRGAGDLEWQSNIVHVAHLFADFTLHEPGMLKRDELTAHAAFRDLGFTHQDGEPLFDSASSIDAELDRYLSP